MGNHFDAEIQIRGEANDGHQLIITSLYSQGESSEFLQKMEFEKIATDLMMTPKVAKIDLDEFSGDTEFIYYEGVDSSDASCKKTSYLVNFEPLDISVPQLLALGRSLK